MLIILKEDNVALAVIETVETAVTVIPTTITMAVESFKTSDKWISLFMKRNKLTW